MNAVKYSDYGLFHDLGGLRVDLNFSIEINEYNMYPIICASICGSV